MRSKLYAHLILWPLFVILMIGIIALYLTGVAGWLILAAPGR